MATLAAEDYFDGRVVLGSPRLTAGIPGSGRLTIGEIRAWLDDPANHEPLEFVLPLGLRDAAEQIYVPPDNPLTRAKIELGRQLFFDRRLSHPKKNFSCGDCHPPQLHYTFGNVLSSSVRHARTAPPVFNRILSREQFWDGRAESLERQARAPIVNPLEMGHADADCVAALAAIEGYRLQFARIFGRVDMENVGRALASFERALVTGPSAWDYHRVLRKLADRRPEEMTPLERSEWEAARQGAIRRPMSEAARQGEALFFSEQARCGACHTGPNLSDEKYHNVGLDGPPGDPDLGRFDVTEKPRDRGAFKTPSLRNVAHTAAYMHAGQLQELEHVVEWFARGGCAEGQNPRMPPLDLSEDEKQDLVEFMRCLTGDFPPVERNRLPP